MLNNKPVPEDEIKLDNAVLEPEFSDLELEDEEESSKDKLQLLREKLKICEGEKQRNLEDLQRARADFLNSKRRLEEQLCRDRERAKDKLLMELLTLADSFDIAVGDKDWESLDKKWQTGIEAIHAKLSSILTSNNLTAIDPVGKNFDPQEHEAVSSRETDDDTHVDTVLAVLQKGYRRGDDIIRPARVVVGTK